MDEKLLYKLEYDFFVHHPHANEVAAEILRFIQYGRHENCHVVLGPSGVGKSHMARRIVAQISQRLDNGWRPGHSYPVILEAPSLFNGKFPWRAFLEEILIKLGDVALDRKIDLDLVELRRKSGERAPPLCKLSVPALEQQLKKRIAILKPIAFIIDEAQHIVKGQGDKVRYENVDKLKSWANQMKETKFVLFGTHEAKLFLNTSDHGGRRIGANYFPRYEKTPEGFREFGAFYKSLIDGLQIKISPKIHENFLYTYNHSLGCPGLLTTWLHRCIAYCIDVGLPSISIDTYRKYRYSKDSLLTMEIAIKEFEAHHRDSLQEFNPDSVQFDDTPYQESMILTSGNNIASKNKKQYRPGQQKPRRHAVNEI